MERVIRLAHSPDSDDAFMFYGLATGKVPTGGIRFAHEVKGLTPVIAVAGHLRNIVQWWQDLRAKSLSAQALMWRK